MGATGHAPKLGDSHSPGAHWRPPLLAGGRSTPTARPASQPFAPRGPDLGGCASAPSLTCGASVPSSAASWSRSRSRSGGHGLGPRAAFSIAEDGRRAGRVPRYLQRTARSRPALRRLRAGLGRGWGATSFPRPSCHIVRHTPQSPARRALGLPRGGTSPARPLGRRRHLPGARPCLAPFSAFPRERRPQIWKSGSHVRPQGWLCHRARGLGRRTMADGSNDPLSYPLSKYLPSLGGERVADAVGRAHTPLCTGHWTVRGPCELHVGQYSGQGCLAMAVTVLAAGRPRRPGPGRPCGVRLAFKFASRISPPSLCENLW